jgi:hypothetical protein
MDDENASKATLMPRFMNSLSGHGHDLRICFPHKPQSGILVAKRIS